MYCKIIFSLIVSILLSISQSVVAGVQIGGSRVVYDGNNQQASISVNNMDDKPYLIQSWVNKQMDFDDNDETFITTPPLFRLDPHAQNSVRIIYTGKPLPQDVESVYWLNIKTVPSTNHGTTNALLLSVKSRMKLFYRPAGIEGDVTTAYQKLQFRQRNNLLYAYNPTPFSVSLYDIKVDQRVLDKPPMVLPKHEVALHLAVLPGANIRWRAINDFGGIYPEQKKSCDSTVGN